MLNLHHKYDLSIGKNKPIHIAIDGDLFSKYIRDNIHHTNYNEFIIKYDDGTQKELGSYMGTYL